MSLGLGVETEKSGDLGAGGVAQGADAAGIGRRVIPGIDG